MEMAIVTAAPAQPKAVSASNPAESNAVSNGNSNFQKTLDGSLKGQSSSDGSAAKNETAATAGTSASAAEKTEQTASTSKGSEVELSAEQLLEAIGGLIADLQELDLSNEPDQGGMQQQLQDLLDQLNAMIVVLGGQQTQPMPVNPGHVVEDLNADVQQALIQLQNAISNGQIGSVKLSSSLDWISSQLQSIGQKVQAVKLADTAADETFELPNELEQNLPSSKAAQPDNVPQQSAVTAGKASVMLDRLNQQAISPQLLQMIASPQDGKESDETEGASSSESLTMNLNANVNALAQDASRSTAAVRVVQVAAPVPAQQFASAMANLMVNKFEVQTVGGMSEAKLTLTPDHLGQVDIRISVVNGQLTAQFVTESSTAKDILDNQLAQLRSNLQSQGLNVEKLEVSQQTVDAQLSQQQQQGGSGWQHEQGAGRIDGDAESEEAAFEAELAQQAVIRGLGYGRAVNVRA